MQEVVVLEQYLLQEELQIVGAAGVLAGAVGKIAAVPTALVAAIASAVVEMVLVEEEEDDMLGYLVK